MLKKITFILVLSSNLVFGQVTEVITLDKNSTINIPTATNVVIVAPVDAVPYNETHVSMQKSSITSESNSVTNVNMVYVEPVNATPVNESIYVSSKSTTEVGTNVELNNKNYIILPAVAVEKYTDNSSKNTIKTSTP